MQAYPKALEKTIQFFRKLPGVGKKTAERFAFEMLSWNHAEIENFSRTILNTKTELSFCKTCGALQEHSCSFCLAKNRDRSTLCIVSSPRDIFFIEESGSFKGQYHVVNQLLSPIDGIDPSHLRLETLENRIKKESIQEVIFALEATVEGDATALFLKNHLKNFSLKTTRLAMGIALGSSLEYTDGGTLARALSERIGL